MDLYKKILANQLDSLNEELESDYSGGMLGDEQKGEGGGIPFRRIPHEG